MRSAFYKLAIGVGAIVVLLSLAITLVPAFFDRIYYRGSVSDHFDGEHFSNPDGEDTANNPGGGSRTRFLWQQLTQTDGRPDWPARVKVTQSVPPARVLGQRMIVTWIGHATVLVQTNGLNILTDPIYADHAGPLGFGPRRVAEPGVRFEDLPKIDIVLISHDHYDHMDLHTLKRLWDRDRPTIVTSLGNDTLIRGAGAEATALDWNQTIAVPIACAAAGRGATGARAGGCAARVAITRNHHWGSRWFVDRNRALWSSFVVQLPGGNLFFAGDTGFGDGRWPGEARRFGPIRLALIPIGAFRFRPNQMSNASHIGPVQAVEVFRRLGARYAIPVHWGTFRLSYEAFDTPPRLLDLVMLCRRMNDFTSYPIGTQIDVPSLDAPRPQVPPQPLPAACRASPFAPDLR